MSYFDEKRRSIKNSIIKSNRESENLNNKNQYVNDKFLTKVPSNIKYSPVKEKRDMKTVQPYNYSNTLKNSKDSKDIPNVTGNIKFDRENMELGYDEKKQQIVLGFPRDDKQNDNICITESKSFKKRAYESEMYEANRQDYFKGGALALRCDVRKANNRNKIKQQIDKISNDNNKETIIDHNLPFHETKTEEELIEDLRQQRKDGILSNQEVQDAITDLENRRSNKQRMNIDFLQKLDKALESIRQQANISYDTIYLIKKKLIDELEDDGTLPNKNNNNQDNQEVKNEEIKEEEVKKENKFESKNEKSQGS